MNIKHRHKIAITPSDSEAERYARCVKQSLKMRGIRAEQKSDKTGVFLSWTDNLSIYIDETAMLINELSEEIETQEASIRDRDEKIDELQEQIELLKKLP